MYKTPSVDELRAYLAEHEITGSAFARIVGSDPRTARRWTAPVDQRGHRDIPWTAWALLRLYVGGLSVEEYRAMVDSTPKTT